MVFYIATVVLQMAVHDEHCNTFCFSYSHLFLKKLGLMCPDIVSL